MNGNHFDIHDLQREYEKGKKQGAVEELKIIVDALFDIEKIMSAESIDNTNTYSALNSLRIIKEKRLLELKGEQK